MTELKFKEYNPTIIDKFIKEFPIDFKEKCEINLKPRHTSPIYISSLKFVGNLNNLNGCEFSIEINGNSFIEHSYEDEDFTNYYDTLKTNTNLPLEICNEIRSFCSNEGGSNEIDIELFETVNGIKLLPILEYGSISCKMEGDMCKDIKLVVEYTIPTDFPTELNMILSSYKTQYKKEYSQAELSHFQQQYNEFYLNIPSRFYKSVIIFPEINFDISQIELKRGYIDNKVKYSVINQNQIEFSRKDMRDTDDDEDHYGYYSPSLIIKNCPAGTDFDVKTYFREVVGIHNGIVGFPNFTDYTNLGKIDFDITTLKN
jgi:hypothetical protein